MKIITASNDPVRASRAPGAKWREAMKSAVRDPAHLCALLNLPPRIRESASKADADFSLLVPRSYISRIRLGDPHDPLLRQVLPTEAERRIVRGFTSDPVGDRSARRAGRLLHKYHGRVLMVTTGACAVHCRYCFRRHYPYAEARHCTRRWEASLEHIARDPSIEEVILSGGDPLALVDVRLAELATMLAGIPHVRRLRIHTRMPIVIPQRVTDSLLDWLLGTRLRPIVVVHANHPRELDEAVVAALSKLVGASIPVLNQSVLLRGVNDDAETLIALSHRLLGCGVLPYYLHQLDRVAGAAHFEVPVEEGIQLIGQMRRRLPGYAVPRYVQDIAGEPSKRVLA